MAFDYAQAAIDASEIIAEFGEAGTVYAPAVSGNDPDTGLPMTAIAQVTLTGIITPKLQYKKNQIDGSNVLASDSFVFFDTAGEPLVGMVTQINGELLRVVAVDSLKSVGGIKIYYKLQLRV
jgi:hypothetical protein